jgi:hypothetical protein
MRSHESTIDSDCDDRGKRWSLFSKEARRGGREAKEGRAGAAARADRTVPGLPRLRLSTPMTLTPVPAIRRDRRQPSSHLPTRSVYNYSLILKHHFNT